MRNLYPCRCMLRCIMAVVFALACAEVNQYDFTLIPSPSIGPVRLAPPITTPSFIACVSSCLLTHGGSCRSVMFNDATRLCTHGTWLNLTEALPSGSEGKLYVLNGKFLCESNQGFSLQKSGSTYACVGRFPLSLGYNYNQSDYFCRDKGGFLMSVKTLDKLAILQRVSGPGFVYFGLDDRQTEGVFVWRDGNELSTKTQRDFLFAAGEPNGRPDTDEDCLVILNSNLCYDGGCSNIFPFVCEIF